MLEFMYAYVHLCKCVCVHMCTFIYRICVCIHSYRYIFKFHRSTFKSFKWIQYTCINIYMYILGTGLACLSVVWQTWPRSRSQLLAKHVGTICKIKTEHSRKIPIRRTIMNIQKKTCNKKMTTQPWTKLRTYEWKSLIRSSSWTARIHVTWWNVVFLKGSSCCHRTCYMIDYIEYMYIYIHTPVSIHNKLLWYTMIIWYTMIHAFY
jgi:hypothetical protein